MYPYAAEMASTAISNLVAASTIILLGIAHNSVNMGDVPGLI
jgi:hypothetical protein